MTVPKYMTCPNCGERRDVSGRYTSPANRKRDDLEWHEEHESGKCSRRLFAHITQDGVALSTTALCSDCLPLRGEDEGFWDPEQHGERVDCTANDALSCMACGWGPGSTSATVLA